jgi:Vitamin K epoxide reductase family
MSKISCLVCVSHTVLVTTLPQHCETHSFLTLLPIPHIPVPLLWPLLLLPPQAFTSKEGALFFNTPNSVFGGLFYLAIVIDATGIMRWFPGIRYLVVLACGFACALSVALASFLIRDRTICPVCLMTYVVNAWITYIQIKNLQEHRNQGKQKST